MLADLRVAPVVPLVDTGDRREDLPRRAIAALEGVLVDEGLLHRVQPAARFGEPLDRRDRTAHRDREGQTGEHPRPVDQYRAGAALAMVAALFRAGEAEM